MANGPNDPTGKTPNIDPTVYESMRRAFEDAGKSSTELLANLETQLELLEDLQKAESSILVKMERQKAIEELTLEINRKKAQSIQERLKDMEEITAGEMAILKLMQAQEKAAKAIPSLTETLFSGDEGGKKLIGQISGIGKSIEQKLYKKMESSILNIDLTGALNKAMDPTEIAKEMAASGGGPLKASFKILGKQLAIPFAKAFSAAMIFALAKYAIEAIKLASSLDKMESEFMQLTGASEEFARSITVAYRDTRMFGATAEETSKAAQSLYSTFTDFTFQNQETRDQLIQTTAVLKKLGMNTSHVTKGMQIMTKSMGMSPGGAAQAMLNMEKLAENLGVPVAQLGADFAANAGRLAKLGDNGEDAFRRLAIASKVTGLEMQKILNITDKFDTFEGAATQAGKLNAALGGNFVNAMDLMMATDPVDRFEMIRDSIFDAGLSFDSMSYYQRKFYADSMGLSDVNDLALILSGNMDMVDGATQQSSQSIEEAADRAREMATLQEKLNILFSQMIPILTPVIDLLSDMAEWMADNARVIKAMTGAFFMFAGALALVATFFGGGPMTAAGGLAGLTVGFAMLTDTVSVGSDKISVFGLIVDRFMAAVGVLFDPFKEYFADIVEVWGLVVDIGNELGEVEGLVIGLAMALDGMFMGLRLMAFGLRMIFLPLRVGFLLLKSWLTGFKEFIVSLKEGQGYFSALGDAISTMFGSLLTGIGEILLSLASSITRLFDPVYTLVGLFVDLDDTFEYLGVTLFKKSWSSSYIEGLVKMANAFGSIATGVLETLNPITQMIKLVETLGNLFDIVIGGATGLFTILASPVTAENILGIAEAINTVSIPKAAAVSVAAVASTAGRAGGTAVGGSTMTVEQPVEISINGDKLANFIIKVTGENIRSIAAIQK